MGKRPRDLSVRNAERAPLDEVLASTLPAWTSQISKLDAEAGAAWDERVRRINAGSATPEDLRVQALAIEAMEHGRPVPREARKMPGPELPRSQHTWHPDELTTAERIASIGIPPLIAQRIADDQVRETRSTKACSRVGRDYTILVLIGAPGCGKTYAAAEWLWNAAAAPPDVLLRKVLPRRFLETPALKEIEFADRPALGFAVALVLDDAGTEPEFLRQDVARVLVARYRNALPTVVTTNLSEKDFVEHYGLRFADRMREVGRFVVVSNDPRDSLRGAR